MNKDNFLALYNSSQGHIDAAQLITIYCKDMGKDMQAINNFVQTLIMVQMLGSNREDSLLIYCYNWALNYYLSKYDIITITNKEGKFIKAF